jgi:hypothetical protein
MSRTAHGIVGAGAPSEPSGFAKVVAPVMAAAMRRAKPRDQSLKLIPEASEH